MEELIRLLGILVAMLVYLLPLLARLRRGRGQQEEDLSDEPTVPSRETEGRSRAVNDPFAEPGHRQRGQADPFGDPRYGEREQTAALQPQSDGDEWSSAWDSDKASDESAAGREWWQDDDADTTDTGPGLTAEVDEYREYDARAEAVQERAREVDQRSEYEPRAAAMEERALAIEQRADQGLRAAAIDERAHAIEQRAEQDPRAAGIQDRARAIEQRLERNEQRAEALERRARDSSQRMSSVEQRARLFDKRSELMQQRLDMIERRAQVAERVMLKRAPEAPELQSEVPASIMHSQRATPELILNAWVLRTLLTRRRTVRLGRPNELALRAPGGDVGGGQAQRLSKE